MPLSASSGWLFRTAQDSSICVPLPRLRRANPTTLTTVRLITGSTLYAAQIAGAVLVLLDATAGLCIAASAMAILTVYSVTGAWLLLVGAHDDTKVRTG